MTRSITIRMTVFAAMLALPIAFASEAPASPPVDHHGSQLACKGIGAACVVDANWHNNCCSGHCKNFSAGFYCYKTESGIDE